MIRKEWDYCEGSIIDQLSIVPGWSHIGTGEKDVTRMTDGLNLYALKVYSNRDQMDEKERLRRTLWEWDNLNYLFSSPFRVHVTEPVELVHENGIPVGLLTVWRNGPQLTYYDGLSIPRAAINRLEKHLKWLSKKGWYIVSDDLSGIFWDGVDLWFPECRLFNQDTYFPSHKLPAEEQMGWYPGEYKKTICSLRNHYQFPRQIGY